MENSKTTGFVAGLGLVLAVVALVLVFARGGGLGGSVIEHNQTDFVNGFKVASDLVFSGSGTTATLNLGSSGTDITSVIVGTANAATTLLPLEATSTDSFTLSVTGVTTSSKCDVQIPNYDLAFGGLVVNGVTVTSGTITFGILNQSGAATSSFPVATTSVAYKCVN